MLDFYTGGIETLFEPGSAGGVGGKLVPLCKDGGGRNPKQMLDLFTGGIETLFEPGNAGPSGAIGKLVPPWSTKQMLGSYTGGIETLFEPGNADPAGVVGKLVPTWSTKQMLGSYTGGIETLFELECGYAGPIGFVSASRRASYLDSPGELRSPAIPRIQDRPASQVDR